MTRPNYNLNQRLSKFCSVFSWLFVSSGCFIQIYINTKTYLNYPVISETKSFIPPIYTLPDISFCSDLNYFINFSKFQELYPAIYDEIKSHQMISDQRQFLRWTSSSLSGRDYFRAKILANLTVSQILSASFDTDQLISNIQVATDESFRYLDDNVRRCCNTTKFIKSYNICFTIECSPTKSAEHRVARQTVLRSNGVLMRIFFNQTLLSAVATLSVYLHPFKTYPRGAVLPFLTLFCGNGSSDVILTFAENTNLRLPAPYNTKCVDYRKFGYESSEAKMESCLNNVSIQLANCSFHQSIEYNYLDYRSAYSCFKFLHLSASSQRVYAEAYKKCGSIEDNPDCIDRLYTPQLLDSSPYRQGVYRVQLTIPRTPSVITEAKPLFTLPQYILYCGSITGFWFGFHVLSLCRYLEMSWNWLLKYKSMKHRSCSKIQAIKRPPKSLNQQLKRSNRRVRKLKLSTAWEDNYYVQKWAQSDAKSFVINKDHSLLI